MKIAKLIFVMSLILSMSSCLKEDTETLVLPKVKHFKPIEEVVPVTIQNQLKTYMPIYSGSTPPEIDGTYLINPMAVVYSSSGGYEPGRIILDEIIEFASQNKVTNVIIYAEKQGESSATSDDVSVAGSDQNFTAYFNTIGTSEGIGTKTATIITGTKTSDGIKNLFYAFVMLEKGDDPNGILVDIGTYRIFKDNNGLASNSTWLKSTIIENGFTTLRRVPES